MPALARLLKRLNNTERFIVAGPYVIATGRIEYITPDEDGGFIVVMAGGDRLAVLPGDVGAGNVATIAGDNRSRR